MGNRYNKLCREAGEQRLNILDECEVWANVSLNCRQVRTYQPYEWIWLSTRCGCSLTSPPHNVFMSFHLEMLNAALKFTNSKDLLEGRMKKKFRLMSFEHQGINFLCGQTILLSLPRSCSIRRWSLCCSLQMQIILGLILGCFWSFTLELLWFPFGMAQIVIDQDQVDFFKSTGIK